MEEPSPLRTWTLGTSPGSVENVISTMLPLGDVAVSQNVVMDPEALR
jgi:hypothetical protein